MTVASLVRPMAGSSAEAVGSFGSPSAFAALLRLAELGRERDGGLDGKGGGSAGRAGEGETRLLREDGEREDCLTGCGGTRGAEREEGDGSDPLTLDGSGCCCLEALLSGDGERGSECE